MTFPKILVTGAGGFVGGWVTEVLFLAGATDIRAGVGRWASCARIARFPVNLIQCDILDEELLSSAMRGVDVVIHCAYSRTSTAASLEGARKVLKCAEVQGVAKVIHMSSAAIYGSAIGDVTEETEPVLPINPYGESKLAAEEACRLAANGKLIVAVLRPTLVYGPFSDLWTVPYITRILSGKWRNFGAAGEGRANLIYVGDLVRFIVHLIDAPLPSYSVFNANGSEIVSFNEYFDRLSKALGRGALLATKESLSFQVALRRPIRELGKYMMKNHQKFLMEAANRSTVVKDVMKRVEADLRMKPNDDELHLYGLDVSYSNRRAIEIGFRPRTSLDDGIAASVQWAKDVGIVADDQIRPDVSM